MVQFSKLCFLVAVVLVVSCSQKPREAERIMLPVVSDGSGMSAFVSKEGYAIEIEHLVIAVSDFQFTIRGEVHASFLKRIEKLLLPWAYAHPGHLAGGEVTGELAGNYLLEPTRGEDRLLGDATLLPGDYHGMNFTFRMATEEDKISPDDPIVGHTIHVKGTAVKGEERWAFSALVDIEEGREMIGAPFTLDLDAADTKWTLNVRVLPVDPSVEGDTFFDGIDFASLDDDGDTIVDIRPGSVAHNILKRNFQVHDHYWVQPGR